MIEKRKYQPLSIGCVAVLRRRLAALAQAFSLAASGATLLEM
jgi:hypothetical protein